jgi:translocator protein
VSGIRPWLGLAVSIGVCFAAAALGAMFTASSVGDWYVALRKPSWNPPAWIFGPVWTVLYLTMAIAAWLVWRRAGAGGAGGALILFGVQLVLNVLWSWFFFGLHNPGAALAGIVALWGAIAWTGAAFWRVSHPAAVLMAPYLAWVTFAAVLNLVIWRLNA